MLKRRDWANRTSTIGSEEEEQQGTSRRHI